MTSFLALLKVLSGFGGFSEAVRYHKHLSTGVFVTKDSLGLLSELCLLTEASLSVMEVAVIRERG